MDQLTCSRLEEEVRLMAWSDRRHSGLSSLAPHQDEGSGWPADVVYTGPMPLTVPLEPCASDDSSAGRPQQ